MITVTISINGEPIYTRTAVNVGDCTNFVNGFPERCSVYQVDTGETLKHKRDDGAVALTRKMLDTIHEVR